MFCFQYKFTLESAVHMQCAPPPPLPLPIKVTAHCKVLHNITSLNFENNRKPHIHLYPLLNIILQRAFKQYVENKNRE